LSTKILIFISKGQRSRSRLPKTLRTHFWS